MDKKDPRNLLYGLQYLRVGCILILSLCHLLQMNGTPPAKEGYALFVDVFLVISGFVIWFTTYPGKTNIFSFVMRRIMRGLPIYWSATTIMILVTHFRPIKFNGNLGWITQRHIVLDWESIIASLLFLPRKIYDAPLGNPIALPAGWTLNVEIIFYITFTMSLCVPKKYRLLTIAALLYSVAVSYIPTGIQIIPRFMGGSPIIMELLAGILLAHYYLKDKLRSAKIGYALIALTLLAFTTLPFYRDPIGIMRVFAYGIPATAIVAAVAMIEREHGLFYSPKLLYVADATFSIYIWHQIIHIITRPYIHNVLPPGLALATDYVLMISLSLVIYHYTERPLIAYLRKHYRNRQYKDKEA